MKYSNIKIIDSNNKRNTIDPARPNSLAPEPATNVYIDCQSELDIDVLKNIKTSFDQETVFENRDEIKNIYSTNILSFIENDLNENDKKDLESNGY